MQSTTDILLLKLLFNIWNKNMNKVFRLKTFKTQEYLIVQKYLLYKIGPDVTPHQLFNFNLEPTRS